MVRVNHSEAANASQPRGLHEKRSGAHVLMGCINPRMLSAASSSKRMVHMRKEGCWRPHGPHCGLVASDTREPARCDCLCHSSVLHARIVLSIDTMPRGILCRAGTAQHFKRGLIHAGTQGRFTDRDVGVGGRPDELECRKALLGACRRGGSSWIRSLGGHEHAGHVRFLLGGKPRCRICCGRCMKLMALHTLAGNKHCLQHPEADH